MAGNFLCHFLYLYMSILKLSRLFVLGTEYWGRKASGILFYCAEDGTVLLLKRASRTIGGEKWGIPGGSLEIYDDYHSRNVSRNKNFFESEREKDPDPEESLFLESALREVQEEMDFSPKINIIKVDDFRDGQFTYKTFISLVSLDEKEMFKDVKLNWEHTDKKWFKTNDIPSNVIGSLKQIISSL